MSEEDKAESEEVTSSGPATEAADRSDGATTEIDAEFVVFRVFAVGREYKDRPASESWTWDGPRGPVAGDRTTVTVGDLTPEFTAAVRALHAWRPFILNSMFGGHYAGKSMEELETVFEDLLPDDETAVAKLSKAGHTHITVTLRRPVRVQASDQRTHRWLTDPGPLDDVSELMEQAGEYLDVTGVRLMGPLGRELDSHTAVYRSNRAFLFASGKTPLLTDIQLRGGALGLTVSGDGWHDRDWQPVSDLLAQPHAPADAHLIKSASRWLWAATAETDDALRRFLFAFFGLEILSNKCGKAFEGALVERLSDSLNGAPLRELFWPSPRDTDSPWRNLLFRFAVMALYLNHDGAAEDVALFKRLASARNDLAHGTAGDDAIHDLPANETIALLRDYLQRVAAAGDL